MRGQGAAHRLAAHRAAISLVARGAGIQSRLVLGSSGLEFFQLQFQLIQQLTTALGRGAELLVAQLGDHQLEMGDHGLGTGRPCLCLTPGQLLGHKRGTQGGDVVGDRVGTGDHAR